jgi:hypothetical protein
LYGQILNPVKWSYAAKKTGQGKAMVFVKADIDTGWHIYYSMNHIENGPIETSFNFMSSNDYALIGKVMEPKPITKADKTFEMDVSYFQSSVVFQQCLKLKLQKSVVKGTINFMVCNDQKCLPPQKVRFVIPVN